MNIAYNILIDNQSCLNLITSISTILAIFGSSQTRQQPDAVTVTFKRILEAVTEISSYMATWSHTILYL